MRQWTIVALVSFFGSLGCQPDKLDLGDAPFKCSAQSKQCPPYYECRQDIDPDPDPATRGICVPRGSCPQSLPACGGAAADAGLLQDQRTIERPDQAVTPQADQHTATADAGVVADTSTVEPDAAVAIDATVPVADTSVTYQKTFPELYFRGTPNAWAATPMTLVADHKWQVIVTFGGSSDERFKFDVHGDWTLNFGDDDQDGVSDEGGQDIRVTSPGDYTIMFNDQTKQYEVQKN